MKYEYKRTKDNGDATSNCNLVGKFPVRFEDFFKWVLVNEKSFRVVFHSSKNWVYDNVECKKVNGKWYWSYDTNIKTPGQFMDKFRDKNVISCWANGGYGQMSYFCTFEE